MFGCSANPSLRAGACVLKFIVVYVEKLIWVFISTSSHEHWARYLIVVPGRIAPKGGCLFHVLRLFFTPWTWSGRRRCGERGDRSMHRRGNYTCSFLCNKYYNWHCVAILIAPSWYFSRAACRARRSESNSGRPAHA